jgi:hypothetical protein
MQTSLPIGLPCSNSKVQLAYLHYSFAKPKSADYREFLLTYGIIDLVLNIYLIDQHCLSIDI